MGRRFGIAGCIAFCTLFGTANGSDFSSPYGPYASVERPKTLLLEGGLPLLMELHRQTEGSAFLGSAWPAPCGGSPLWNPACPPLGKLKWSERGDYLSARWIGGVEERFTEDDQTEAIDVGAVVSGRWGNLNFSMDARIFSELHDAEKVVSWDGEFIEVQKEGANSRMNYVSYARYRGNFSLDLAWGRFGWRRDAPHWGPSYSHALVFHRDAVPFDHLVYEGKLGPVRVISLMGDLAIDGWGKWLKNPDSRTVYAHRYEWDLHPSVMVGISEQLILYQDQAWWGMVPVIPLFMMKGQLREANNNGNIAFDVQWRPLRGLRLYGEFLVDDVSEPTSILNDYWKNRWGATLGAHAATTLQMTSLGLLGEWTRIEPWVYTHYVAKTAQSAHHGAPLGDPLGPDLMAWTWRAYAERNGLHLALVADWTWKGEGRGSSFSDVHADEDGEEKEFLQGVNRAEWSLAPELLWTNGLFSGAARFRWGRSAQEALFRISVGF